MELIRDDLLGWHPFRNLLARFAATPPGQDRARALMPHHALTTVRGALRETTEARRALTAEGPPPWDGTGDARPILAEAAPAGAVARRSRPGRACATGSTAAARLRAYGQRIAAVAPGLGSVWADLPAFPDLAGTLHDALDPDGRLTDRASPRLRALRRQITTLRADLQARVERLLDHPAVQPALQERYVTVRNGRYVIPVRDDARRAVRGIIHDRSQSGATVFVEPEETIPLNNELTRLCLEERDEEQRVLGELTDAVRRVLPALAELVEGLGALDLIFARAALAERLEATEPEVDAGGDLDLRAARHPLLVAQRWGAAAGRGRGRPGRPPGAGRPARPGPERPERGRQDRRARNGAASSSSWPRPGATFPPRPGSRVPLADQVLAVIGDEQSLAQDLSTFSSFVRQVREILDVAGPGSLVLLDELGAGTDPIEGAALGAALLEALARPRGPRHRHDAPRAPQGLRPGGAAAPERDGRVRRRAARADVPAGVRAPRAEPRADDRPAARPPAGGHRPRPDARRRGEPPARSPPGHAGGADPGRRGARRGGRPPRGGGGDGAGGRPGRGRARPGRGAASSGARRSSRPRRSWPTRGARSARSSTA